MRPGEFLAVLGFSGTGKTTLINLLAGLTLPDKGEVSFNGAPVTGPGPERGLVFQSYALMPWLTVARNIGLAVDAVHGRLSKAERAELVTKYVGMVGPYPCGGTASGGIVRRNAAAGRGGARAGDGAAGPADGRAAVGAGRADAGECGVRDRGDLGGGPPDGRSGHERRGRGAGAGRPHRLPEPRRDAGPGLRRRSAAPARAVGDEHGCACEIAARRCHRLSDGCRHRRETA